MIKNVQEKLNHVDCGTLKYPGCQNLFKTAAFFFWYQNLNNNCFGSTIKVQKLN